MARKYEHEAKERLRRMNIVVAGLETSNSRKQQSSAVGGPEVEDAWYEDSGSIPPATDQAAEVDVGET